jgi:hypothetical protein
LQRFGGVKKEFQRFKVSGLKKRNANSTMLWNIETLEL